MRLVLALILSFVLAQVLIHLHYHWSAIMLEPSVSALKFNAPDAAGGHIGPMPRDQYLVVFRFPDSLAQYGSDLDAIDNQLMEGCISVDIQVRGIFGRNVLQYSSESASRDWRYRTHGGGNPMLLGPAEFSSLPLERYKVFARISGDNALLASQQIFLGLQAGRDGGYHGLGHIAMHYLVGALFILIAFFGMFVWISIKLKAYLQRQR